MGLRFLCLIQPGHGDWRAFQDRMRDSSRARAPTLYKLAF